MKNRIYIQNLSIYFHTVVKLIYEYHIDSLFKLEFCAFIININEISNTHTNKACKDLVSRFLLNFHYSFLSHYSDFIYVNEAINILENNGYIKVENDNISILADCQPINKKEFKYNNELDLTLNEIKKMTVESFKEEVINNV